jgi:hypothetical protein
MVSINRRSQVQDGPSKKHETLSEKELKQKGLGGMVKVVECLPSKFEVLISNQYNNNNKKRKKSQ